MFTNAIKLNRKNIKNKINLNLSSDTVEFHLVLQMSFTNAGSEFCFILSLLNLPNSRQSFGRFSD